MLANTLTTLHFQDRLVRAKSLIYGLDCKFLLEGTTTLLFLNSSTAVEIHLCIACII